MSTNTGRSHLRPLTALWAKRCLMLSSAILVAGCSVHPLAEETTTVTLSETASQAAKVLKARFCSAPSVNRYKYVRYAQNLTISGKVASASEIELKIATRPAFDALSVSAAQLSISATVARTASRLSYTDHTFTRSEEPLRTLTLRFQPRCAGLPSFSFPGQRNGGRPKLTQVSPQPLVDLLSAQER